jgi:hypothetical protein
MLLIMHMAMAPEVALDVMCLVIQTEVVGQDTMVEAKSFATVIKDLLMGSTTLRSLMQRSTRRKRSVKRIPLG